MYSLRHMPSHLTTGKANTGFNWGSRTAWTTDSIDWNHLEQKDGLLSCLLDSCWAHCLLFGAGCRLTGLCLLWTGKIYAIRSSVATWILRHLLSCKGSFSHTAMSVGPALSSCIPVPWRTAVTHFLLVGPKALISCAKIDQQELETLSPVSLLWSGPLIASWYAQKWCCAIGYKHCAE